MFIDKLIRIQVQNLRIFSKKKVQTSYTSNSTSNSNKYISTWHPLFYVLVKNGFGCNFIHFLNLVNDRLLPTYQACTLNFMNSMMNNRFRFLKNIPETKNSICEKENFSSLLLSPRQR